MVHLLWLNHFQKEKEMRKQVLQYLFFFYFNSQVEICWSVLVCKHDIDSTICTYYTKVLTVFVVSRTSLVFQYNWILVFIHFCDWIKIDQISGFHMYVERIVQCYCHMSWCLTYSKKYYGIVTISYCIKETKVDYFTNSFENWFVCEYGLCKEKTWHSCKCLCSLDMVSMHCVK